MKSGYVIVAVGLLLSFMGAFIRFLDYTYYLDAWLMTAGMLPYLFYYMIVALHDDRLTNWSGASLLLTHGGAMLWARFVAGMPDVAWLYYAPLLLTVLLVPLFVRALHKTRIG
ncbi:MAG: hypothetical protein KJ914_15410 [Gammaproteobacteria bacterium]|nr:hypothetical protein [Gammaproteobacteria bacterium]MBU1723335.1 hypothetical protein [Gammaproteobacteria bacterium]MBU2006630.1 hypothetical protein [Gammaproteobacteria bacterium]